MSLASDLRRIAYGTGALCCEFAPASEKPFVCSKREGHKGWHCAHVPELRNGRVRLRSILVWRRRRAQ